MDVDLIFKIAAIGILVAVLNLVLARSGREEQAMMTTLAGLVVVLMMLVRQISDLFDLIKSLFSLLLALSICGGVLLYSLSGMKAILALLEQMSLAGGLSEDLLRPLVKTVGIALVSRVGAELCRDANQGALATVVETAGAFSAIVVAIPLFTAVWELLRGML